MFFIIENVPSHSRNVMLTGGMMSSGNGTLFHCTPPSKCVSTYPHEPSQKRLYILASVKLRLYCPPNTFFTPVVWLSENSGASRFTGQRCCLVLMKVCPGQ